MASELELRELGRLLGACSLAHSSTLPLDSQKQPRILQSHAFTAHTELNFPFTCSQLTPSEDIARMQMTSYRNSVGQKGLQAGSLSAHQGNPTPGRTEQAFMLAALWEGLACKAWL